MIPPEEESVWRVMARDRLTDPEEIAAATGITVEQAQIFVDRIGTPLEEFRKPEPTHVKLLYEGARLTGGDRNKTYGSPFDNLDNTATLWSAYLHAKYRGQTVDEVQLQLTAEDVAHMMQLLKMARTIAPGYHADNYIDNATYGAIAGECRQTLEDLK